MSPLHTTFTIVNITYSPLYVYIMTDDGVLGRNTQPIFNRLLLHNNYSCFQCIQLIVPTTRTLLVTHESHIHRSDTFRYKRTNFRQHNVPGSKPTASDKPLFTWLHSLQWDNFKIQLCFTAILLIN
jgi:hypothetical protein